VTTLQKMQPGEVSQVLRAANGFHLLKLNEMQGGPADRMVVQTHARHILIKPTELSPVQDVERRLGQLRERIVNGEDFATLAKAHSQDVASGLKGGDLGWVSPGEMVPEFEKVLDELQPGEVSQPFRSRFGLHIAQVLDRRREDMTDELRRAEARKQIKERKAGERYEQWIRQLRDEAYVEYRLEEDL
jgi:peptidyl-prolyl cis-trans isomerase SurA